ncbi:protein piccolo [Denticeps clupeoides]|uniref:protein piccolo n=1 Tax=Denticeps clupeoides TaxID=299321 RepID=UPI0010A4448F|nr:protein piccolo-like [Denticeps clupeoides]XP_028841565.1 protein piccolo-like [Denticeps clupeoides]XP_028841566.1 protein piccolo-like [Denticeps clupeoides]
MKPDGVATAALDADPALEVAPAGDTVDQPSSASQTTEAGHAEPKPAAAPAAKTGDSAGKTKAPAKSKPAGTTAAKTPGPASRPAPSLNRAVNGVPKPQTNGVTKKAAGSTPDRKNTPTGAPAKKAGTASRTPTKPAERGTPAANNGAKAGAAPPLRKAPPAKPKPAAPASKPPSAAATRPGAAAAAAASPKADKPAVSKSSRPASSRPASATARPATLSTTKTPASTAKPAASTTKAPAAKPATPRSVSAVPSTGRAPPQPSKAATPVKKDVGKPSTPVTKKPTTSPAARPSPVKTSKPDTPKSTPTAKADPSIKKTAPGAKGADAKLGKAKTVPSKDPGAGPKSNKASSPKKAVGSSTPMPVKRGPKPTQPKEGEVHDAAAAAAAAATVVAAAAVETMVASEPQLVEALGAEEETMAVQEEGHATSTHGASVVHEQDTSALLLDAMETAAPTLHTSEPQMEATAPQLVAELNLAHLDLPVSSESPLGTTVMSPPSSPTGPTCTSMDPQLDLADPWGQSHSTSLAEGALPQDKHQEDTVPSSTGGEPGEVQDAEPSLLGRTSVDPHTAAEKEEEVEKADQEINEDDEGDEEDAQEQRHEPPLMEDLLTDSSSFTISGWHRQHAEEKVTSQQMVMVPEDHSPLESSQNDRDDFDVEQLPKGSPCTKTFSNEDDDDEDEDIVVDFNIDSAENVADFNVASKQADLHNVLKEEEQETIPAAFDVVVSKEPVHYQVHQEEEEEDRVDTMSLEHHKVYHEEEEEGGVSDKNVGFQLVSETRDERQESEEDQLADMNLGLKQVDEFCQEEDQVAHVSVSFEHVDVHKACREDYEEEDYVENEMGTVPYHEVYQEEQEDTVAGVKLGSEYAAQHVVRPEEEEEEDRVVDMDVCSERVEHHKVYQEEEEDEDVEMASEGVTESGLESCGNVDEDDFTEDVRLDNMNRTTPQPSIPPTTAWGQSNPFCDTWAPPPTSHFPSDFPSTDPQSSPAPELEPRPATPPEVPAEPAPVAAGDSESSTPEEPRDYDSSSGVESPSDKRQTPVPTAQPDLEQDLGIHLERGDGEDEEAETLPADDVLGGPPTAPTSAPSSPSTSGDEASDTEGEMQINDPDTPVDGLAALTEDEAAEMHAGDVEEDGGGTPQSANSVASYGFDCTTSNSNAHSTAESCGKSPGIFSLENEDQLTEEAKDPSLIKELTAPAATALDLLALGQPQEEKSGLVEHQYMLCGKSGADLPPEEEDEEMEEEQAAGRPSSPRSEGGPDVQPPYYSTICDKTDNFVAGNV